MKTEDKLIIAAVVGLAGYIAFKDFITPDKVSHKDAITYIQKAAQKRDASTWFAPLQQKQAIAETNADGSTTTYFLDEEDYNSMSRWQRTLFSWDYPLKDLFD